MLLLSLPEVIHAEVSDHAPIVRFDVDSGGEGACVPQLDRLGRLLAENDITEINNVFLNGNERLLARADERDVDSTSLTENRKGRFDVHVEARRERDGDGGRETGGHAARRRVLNVKEVFDFVLEWQQLERVEGEGDVRKQNRLRVRNAHREVLQKERKISS